MGKSEKVALLCGALGVDHVEFDVWRQIQEQVSNKLLCHQRQTLAWFLINPGLYSLVLLDIILIS